MPDKAPVMNKLRRPARAPIIALAIILLCAARHPARSEGGAPLAATSARPSCQRSAFRVVVDVGHTVDVPGAISARGVAEYAFNLRLGEEVRQALLAAGFDKTVLLITAEPPPLGLVKRTKRANSWPADLVVSIHHDSVPNYLLETWEYDGQQNHFSDRFKGYAIFISNNNADRDGSLKFGRLLGKELQARGLQYTPHYTLALMRNRRRELVDGDTGVYRYDQLIVLRDARMPAVLLEAGSIVNREEELELANPERRSLISAAVATAVEEFCTARSRPSADRLVHRPRPQNAAAPPSRANPAPLAR